MISENNRTEFKQQLTNDIEKEVVAFLNYHGGGFIYIGVDKRGHAVGIENIDEVQLTLKNRIKSNISPSAMGLFDILVENRNDKEIIKIIVASGSEKPYYIKKYGMSEKGCFIRVGSASEPMSVKQIESIFSQRVRNSLGKITSPRQDLTFEQLKIYYEAVGKPLNDQFIKNLELYTENKRLNYAAYLMADINNVSMKVAKYKGNNRVDLIENYEFGYCSLIKATKQILDKVEIENTTFTEITSQRRIENRLWDQIALREAIINAIVHNDYTNEVPPKIEFFDNRIEITSCGSLPDQLSKKDFFEGVSMPRNKNIMRIFKDLELVEHLGSGVPRILQSYSREHFQFLDNFIRMSFPIKEVNRVKSGPSRDQVGTKLEPSREFIENTLKLEKRDFNQLIDFCSEPKALIEIMTHFGWANRTKFRNKYITPLIQEGVLEMTIPDKPNSRLQKYRLTEKGIEIKEELDL